MNLIARLGRLAARRMYKHAWDGVNKHPNQPGGPLQGPTAEHDLANKALTSPAINAAGGLSKTVPGRGQPGAEGRDKYRNVAQPGSGGSMWGDKIIGRGGAHPDSPWANEMLNNAYGAGQHPIGQPFDQKQSIHSKRMLAQDPRGRGGWAYQTKQQAQDAMGGKPSPPLKQPWQQ